MSRILDLAVLQPPAPGGEIASQQLRRTALARLEEAGTRGADIACLPEFLNVMGRPDGDWLNLPPAAELLEPVAALAARHSMYVILPLLEQRSAGRFNCALIVDRQGQVVGRYDKTHLTASERERYGIVPGDTYPVFDLDFGRIGIMICYDGHFPEVSRILALHGAEIIFFPTLQRHLTAALLDAQVRTRAVDNGVYLARSSYGYPDDVAWTPGMMVGKSCIVDFEGAILADAGFRTGLCLQRIDLDRPRVKERSYGGETGDPRQFLLEDRRPETYAPITSR